MSVRLRNNVTVSGTGPTTLVFAHGFSCNQSVWRFMAPAFEERYRVVLFDLTGSGQSDLAAYDRDRYGSLHAHANDLLAIVDACGDGPVVSVGHSVSAMIGLLAGIRAPERFRAQVMIAPSPCYVDDDSGYRGGFSSDNMDELLAAMEADYLGWSRNMAPVIMGAPNRPHLGAELTDNFCRNDPAIARHFGRVTFLSDHRADLDRATVPALILQCSDDPVAPVGVGTYLQRRLAGSVLREVRNVGHCPHMSAPAECVRLTQEFLDSLELQGTSRTHR